jgi:hypothetical protein
MKHIIDAIHSAAADTAEYITHDLRQTARKSGWGKDVVNNTHVHYGEKGFVAKVGGEHRDAAFVHEYGDEDHPPTAVLRRYANKSPNAEAAFIKNLQKKLEEL